MERNAILMIGSTLLLTGCAGAHLTAVQEAHDQAPPATLVVSVAHSPTVIASTPPAAQDRTNQTIPILEQVLDNKLQAAGIAVRPASESRTRSGTEGLRLEVEVEKVVAGNVYGRDLIGFGSGQSSITTHVRLVDGRETPPQIVLSFDAKSTSGSLPGVLLSGGPVGVAVHGTATLISAATSDGHQEIDRTANAISRKVQDYYRQQGWLPPAAAASTS